MFPANIGQQHWLPQADPQHFSYIDNISAYDLAKTMKTRAVNKSSSIYYSQQLSHNLFAIQ